MRLRALMVSVLVVVASGPVVAGCGSGAGSTPGGATSGGAAHGAAGAGGPDVFSVAGGGLGNDVPEGRALTMQHMSVSASGGGRRVARGQQPPVPVVPSAPLPPPSPPVEVEIFADNGVGKDWELRVTAAMGGRLTPGDYPDVGAEPDTKVPTIDIAGDGHSCTVASAKFTVLEDDVDDKGNLLDLNLTFDITCQVNPVQDPKLVGYVRYHATRATPIPAIPEPPPTPTGPPGAHEPMEFAVRESAGWPPAKGRNLDLDVTDVKAVKVSGTLSSVHVTVGGWSMKIEAMAGQRLQTGVYGATTRRAAVGGIGAPVGVDVEYGGVGCRNQDGRLTIYEIHVDDAGQVDRFNASFEQAECDAWNPGVGGRLTGLVRYHAVEATPYPWRVNG